MTATLILHRGARRDAYKKTAFIICLGREFPILHSKLTPAWISFVLATGLFLSIGLYFSTRGWEQKELEKHTRDLVQE